MVSKKTLNTLIASAVAVTVVGAASTAVAMEEGKEKCYGVVKAGKNDCGSASKSHACAAHATTDASADEWLALPKGVCEKLAHGSLTPGMADKMMDEAKDEMMDKAKDAMH